jgi:hypothetical protein
MKLEFKTRTFSAATLQSEEIEALKNDVAIVGSLDIATFPKILDLIKRLLESKTTDERTSIINEMVASGAVPSHQAAASGFRLGNFFFRTFSNKQTKDDKVDELIQDIEVLGVEKQHLAGIKMFVQAILQQREWYESYKRQEDFRKGLFPSLIGVGTTVDLRGVFNDEIRFDESIDSYASRVKLDKDIPIMPIVSVSLTLDSGYPDRFCFQASPKYIGWLIEELKAALHKATMLEKKYVRVRNRE